MDGLNMVITVTDRERTETAINLFRENNVFTTDIVLGQGTASRETLDYLYLNPSEKAIVFGVVTGAGLLPLLKAYPGDVFYLHSRLLERAAHLSDELGGGSITVLPIIETQAGDVSAYIPTNVISITDGQIFLESELFFTGQRPAVNVGISVSRVGGDAQIKAMKKVSGKLKLELAQYRELASFSQFGSDIDKDTKARLDHGRVLMEVLKQGQYKPMDVEDQVVSIYAASHGYMEDVPIDEIKEFETELLAYIRVSYPEIKEMIAKTGQLDEETEQLLTEAIKKFKEMK